MPFNWLVTDPVVPTNSAAALCDSKRVVKTGNTPVLEAAARRNLL
jgi:hypothetical protein